MKCFSLLASEDEIALFMPVPASGSEAALGTRGVFFDHLNKFLDWMMSFTHIHYDTGQLIQSFSIVPQPLVLFEGDHGFFSKVHPLVGQYSPCKADVTLVEALLGKIDESVVDPQQRLFYFQEILSKVLAYRNLEEGDKIVLPDFLVTNNKATYIVEKVFNLGMTLPAFALTCLKGEKPPIILYRGTHLDLTDAGGLASVMADLDLYGPGYTAFFKSKDQIEAFCLKQKLKGKRCAILGFSLGGILTTYTAVFLADYVDLVLSAAFSPPGVQKKLLKYCQEQKIIDNLCVYVNQNDPISKWGFLIGNIKVLSLNERMGPLKAHTYLMSGGKNLSFYECDVTEENQRHRYFFLPEK